MTKNLFPVNLNSIKLDISIQNLFSSIYDEPRTYLNAFKLLLNIVFVMLFVELFINQLYMFVKYWTAITLQSEDGTAKAVLRAIEKGENEYQVR